MRFDDRLATALGQPAADARGRAVQWRQLVALLARGGEISPNLAERALARVAQLMEDVPTDLLAATGRAIASRDVPVELVALFAARGAAASAALLTAAELSPAGWRAVRTVAAEDVLALLSALEPATGDTDPGPGDASEDKVSSVEAATTISAVSVNQQDLAVFEKPELRASPALPAGLFRWETSQTGEIDWVEGAPRAALVGRSVAESFAEPFAARLPFADEPLVMVDEGALAGEWRWTGTPSFFADTGRFAGYRGVARREGSSLDPASEEADDFMPAEDDGLRELMHELRTPLNAIIGFSEIIEGQYLGPAHRAYRERATEIVRQARGLSDAVDNLDLAARLRSGRLGGEGRSGSRGIVGVLEELRVEADLRQVRVRIENRAGAAEIALPPMLAERLVRQFATAMLQPAIAGEQVAMLVGSLGSSLAIGIDRVTALKGLSEQQLLGDRGGAGMRFALRLVQGLSAMTGGRLEIGADRLVLLLPMAN